jgi:hypothetical protein
MEEKKIITETIDYVKQIKNYNGRPVKEKIKITSHYYSVLHSDKGPAVIKDNGDKLWYKMGELHNENGPAMKTQIGEFWFYEGKQHRENFPALILKSGRREWYIHGLRHRTDGPAIEDPIKGNEWWENGVFIRKED